MKQKGRGIGGFSTLIIILFVVGLYVFISQLGEQQRAISNEEFMKVLSEEKIESAVIVQDKAIPTGSVELKIKGQEGIKVLQVSDVNDAQTI